jgi:hypothetical protein
MDCSHTGFAGFAQALPGALGVCVSANIEYRQNHSLMSRWKKRFDPNVVLAFFSQFDLSGIDLGGRF